MGNPPLLGCGHEGPSDTAEKWKSFRLGWTRLISSVACKVRRAGDSISVWLDIDASEVVKKSLYRLQCVKESCNYGFVVPLRFNSDVAATLWNSPFWKSQRR